MKLPARSHILILFALALAIRLIGLDQSLWLDEAITAQTIQRYSPFDLVAVFSPVDFHPPLHYWLLQGWSALFGRSEVALRLPSLLFSLAAGWWVYQTGRELGGEKTGWWSAAFFLCNPLIVYYAQEARMYALMVCLVAANFFFVSKISRQKATQAVWLGFVATVLLSLFTFYGVVFYLWTVCVFWLWKRQWKALAITIATSLLGVGLLSPLLLQQLQHSVAARSLVPNWSSVLGPLTLKNLALIPLKMMSGRLSFWPKWAYYALAGLWTLLTSLATTIAVRKQAWLIFFLVVPLTLGAVFSLFTPLLQYFRFLYLAIFVALALAVSLSSHKWLRWGILVGFAAWSLAAVAIPQFHREDWKTLAQALQQQSAPVYLILASGDPLRYYAPQLEQRSLFDVGNHPPTAPEITVLPYTADIYGLKYQDQLQQAGYQLTQEHSVRGLSWQTWQLLP